MTKKKIVIYTLILIISVIGSAVFRYYIQKDDSALFNDACKMVLAPSCQNYIMDISIQKKYDEAIQIQKVRTKENVKVARVYKKKLDNKKLLKMTSSEVEETLKSCIETQVCKKDYFLIKTAELAIQDAVVDSMAVAQIQKKEFNDINGAIFTLKYAKKILNQNKYISNYEFFMKYIDKELESF